MEKGTLKAEKERLVKLVEIENIDGRDYIVYAVYIKGEYIRRINLKRSVVEDSI